MDSYSFCDSMRHSYSQGIVELLVRLGFVNVGRDSFILSSFNRYIFNFKQFL